MKVSALIVTYNQERYVAEAIESALRQQASFPYEIVISEDCSTDGTREIVRAYEAGNPGRIHVLYSARNLGGVENFVAAWHACRGEYVALLEGDDYWTSEDKIQKQAQFLDAHPQCAMCVHGVTEIYEDSDREPVSWISPQQQAILVMEDLLLDNFVYSCSAMLRRRVFHDFRPWVYDFSVSDVPLWVEAARHGAIGFIPEFLGVYRVHSGGVWSGKDVPYQVEQTIELYEQLNRDLHGAYEHVLRRTLARFEGQLALERAGVPADAPVCVLSGGDDELLKLYRPARHLGERAAASDEDAIRLLEEQVAGGWQYLLVPQPGLSWLESSPNFLAHARSYHRLIHRSPKSMVFALGRRVEGKG